MNINHLHDKDIRGQASIDNLIRLALAEDIGSGDITTNLLISEGQRGEAYVMSKEDMVKKGWDSPDDADAFALTFIPKHSGSEPIAATYRQRKSGI